MKKIKSLISVFLALIMLLTSSSIAQAIEATLEVENDYVIVGSEETIENIESAYGGDISEDGSILADVTLTNAEVRDIVRENDEIIIEENIIFEGDSTDEEVEMYNQWYLDAIGVKDIAVPENNIKIALIDSGVSFSEDIIIEDSIKLIDDGNESVIFTDASGHGTAMAGIIAAQDNDVGITGINPNARLYSAHVLDNKNQAPLSRIIQGINWAIDNDVDIINMSFGTSTNSVLLHNAVKEAYNAGIMLVASAGNSADLAVKYPAAYSEVIAVGATNISGEIWENTSTGDELDIFAPGEKILSSALFDGVMAINGTSASTAQVTAIVSLLLNKDKSKSPDFIKRLIVASSKKIENIDVGFIDYAYACDIYDDFALNYTDDSVVDYINESVVENYNDSTETLVEGLWGGTKIGSTVGHYAQSNEAGEAAQAENASIKDTHIDILNNACIKVDTYYGSASNENSLLGKKIQAFHGRGNFVANIRFVSNFAQYMRMGNGLETALNKCYAKFPDILELVDGEYVAIDSYKYSDGNLMLEMAEGIRDIYNRLGTGTGIYEGKTHGPKRRMMVFLGVALHMIGDVYAHRTIVPAYSISDGLAQGDYVDESLSEYADQFGSNDFIEHSESKKQTEDLIIDYVNDMNPHFYNETKYGKNGKYMRNPANFLVAARGGYLEFQDVIRFETSKSSFKYDDCAKFCEERHSEAKRLCKKYLLAVLKANYDEFTSVQKFYPKFIVPSDKHVKLNNLKNYVIEAGLSTSGYSDSSWAKYSTTEYV